MSYTPTLLRDAPATADWLAQFDAADRASASLLIESLTLVSHSQFQDTLYKHIKEVANASSRPVSLFATRKVEPEISNLLNTVDLSNLPQDPKERKRRRRLQRMMHLPHYFDLTDKRKRPNAVKAGAGIGSEGPVANLLRDIAERDGTSRFLDHPSIRMMASVKSREMFLVDDIVGSGRRSRSFVDAFS